ncbi:hypothetical protein HK102_012123 [Quaeritorhiza haematococci]|nr:hypothetical protein HK102_012123 [Quaeritorhiza haematococci]
MPTDPAVAAAFQNPQLLQAIQGRLNSLVGQSSGYVENLPEEVKRRLNALQNLHDKHSELEAKFRDEVLALEKKYLGLYQPLYDKRTKIVTGEVEPTPEECERKQDDETEEVKKEEEKEVKTEKEPENKEPVKGIPEFWLTAFKNNPTVADLITPKDEEALKFLTDIKVSYLDDNPGFKLEFFFQENPFFAESVLSKTYYLINSAELGYGDVVYDRAEGCKITWKEGKNLSVTVEIKKQRHKGTNKTRTVKKEVPAETFFQFFTPPKAPADDEDADEEELQELDAKLQADYEIGEVIKEKLVPHAVDWFTGKALEYEDEYDFDGEEGDWYDNEDDDDEDDDDDDDDDDDAAPSGAKGGDGEKPPECKQQ